MILSVQSSPILEFYGIDEGMRVIAEAGFGGVDLNLDIALPGSKIRAGECCGFFDKTDDEMRELLRPCKEASEKYGVKYVQAHAPFPCFVNNAATDAYVLEALKKTAMLCGWLGCPQMIVHPGFLPNDMRLTPEEEWDVNIRLYSALIPALKEYGVVCCLENMFSDHRGKIMEAICSNPFEAVRYIDALNEIAGEKLFGFCFDVGHATLLGHDPYTTICQLGGRITCLHVHDNNGLTDQHLFPYMGITDWDSVCRGLKETGYSGTLSFETFNALHVFDRALAPQLLNLLAATGRLFSERIQG